MTEMAVMVTLPTYHICLICTVIESPPQGGLPPQGAYKAYVRNIVTGSDIWLFFYLFN